MITIKKLTKENCMASINKKNTAKAKAFFNTHSNSVILNKIKERRLKQIDACVSIQDIIFLIANIYTDDYDGPSSCDISILSWQIEYFINNLQKNTLKDDMFSDDYNEFNIEAELKENKYFYAKLREYSKYLNQANYDELASYMLGNVITYDETGIVMDNTKKISKRAFENCITFYELEHMQWNPAGINGMY